MRSVRLCQNRGRKMMVYVWFLELGGGRGERKLVSITVQRKFLTFCCSRVQDAQLLHPFTKTLWKKCYNYMFSCFILSLKVEKKSIIIRSYWHLLSSINIAKKGEGTLDIMIILVNICWAYFFCLIFVKLNIIFLLYWQYHHFTEIEPQ